MLDGILNNRKEWNARKEEYEAKLKAIEDEKAAKEAAAASKGVVTLCNNQTLKCITAAAMTFAQSYSNFMRAIDLCSARTNI